MPHAFRFIPLPNNKFLEVPISTVNLAKWNLPCGGGGYFRLLPYAYSKWSINRLNRHERQASVLYFHPWEIDPDQPRPKRLSLKSRVRHYTNLGRMEARLSRVFLDFRWDRMDRVFLPRIPRTYLTSFMTYQVKELTEQSREAWDQFALASPTATFFHLSEWQDRSREKLWAPRLLPLRGAK